MTLTDEQIKLISSSILISDVIVYIDEHQKEYEEFIKTEKKKKKQDRNNSKYHNIKEIKI